MSMFVRLFAVSAFVALLGSPAFSQPLPSENAKTARADESYPTVTPSNAKLLQMLQDLSLIHI